MPTISTFLTFNTQAEDAARFYTSIFPNSKITRVNRYPDLGPQAPFKPGSVMTVEFTLDGRSFVALNAAPARALPTDVAAIRTPASEGRAPATMATASAARSGAPAGSSVAAARNVGRAKPRRRIASILR